MAGIGTLMYNVAKLSLSQYIWVLDAELPCMLSLQ